MSKEQKPIVAIGHEFAAGTVKAINNDHVLLDTKEGVKRFSFSQIETKAVVDKSPKRLKESRERNKEEEQVEERSCGDVDLNVSINVPDCVHQLLCRMNKQTNCF